MHVVFLLLLVVVGCSKAQQITKQNNAYSGIVVAIHKSIPENAELIVKTLNLLTESSALLHQVTHEEAFFKNITIVLPMSWNASIVQSVISGLNSVTYEKIYGDRFRDAAIRINQKSEKYQDEPYTLQNGGCGEPGEYIHLTPDFIIDKDNLFSKIYGPKDRQLVHEWMHLRYGVFDEYGIAGDEDFPLYYLEDGKMHVSACDSNVKGWIETPNGQPCSIINGIPMADCRFFPDITGSNATASLMSFPYIPSIQEFCDKDVRKPKANRHNTKAHTKHNWFCDGLSIWEVMRQHNDFKYPSNNELYVPPNFRVVQPASLDPRFILVLDVSSSMNPHISILHRAGTVFVEDQLPDGSFVGIVTYSTNAQTVQELVKINANNRKTVSQKVPRSAGGMTAIGKGLLEALNVLRRGNQPTEGAIIVLMTDGAENQDPRMNTVIPQIVAAKVKVNTLAFGKAAEKVLENIAIATKGKTYFFDPNGGGQTSDLDLIFGDTVTIQSDIDFQSEQLIREPLVVTSTEQTLSVHLDRELGKNTIFVISGDVASVDMSVDSPSGTRYNSASKEYEKDVNIKKRIQIHLPLAEPGLWNVTVTRTGGSNAKIEMVMSSDPRSPNDHPVRVKVWSGSIRVVDPKKPPTIFASVMKGDDPIIRADVEASVTMPNGIEIIKLRDDGIDPDKLANDGIYSAHFTKFTTNGRFAVFARVVSNGTALIKKKRTASLAPAIPKSIPNGRLNDISASSFELKYFITKNSTEDVFEVKYNKTEPFNRTADGGSFSMENVDPKVDKIPPNRVTDLKVISNKVEKDGSKVVTIQWTSPGDDMNSGNASSLEIRVSLNNDQLRNDKFETSLLLNDDHVVEGSLIPVPGREKQTLTVRIPTELVSNSINRAVDVYIALRASDAQKNIAAASNIVSAHFGYDIPEPTKPTPHEEKEKDPTKPTPHEEKEKDTNCRRRHFKNKLLLSLVLENIDEL